MPATARLGAKHEPGKLGISRNPKAASQSKKQLHNESRRRTKSLRWGIWRGNEMTVVSWWKGRLIMLYPFPPAYPIRNTNVVDSKESQAHTCTPWFHIRCPGKYSFKTPKRCTTNANCFDLTRRFILEKSLQHPVGGYSLLGTNGAEIWSVACQVQRYTK